MNADVGLEAWVQRCDFGHRKIDFVFERNTLAIRYFEVQPRTGVRKVLFVRVGQDEPLFDEKTLRLLPPR